MNPCGTKIRTFKIYITAKFEKEMTHYEPMNLMKTMIDEDYIVNIAQSIKIKIQAEIYHKHLATDSIASSDKKIDINKLRYTPAVDLRLVELQAIMFMFKNIYKLDPHSSNC